MWTFPVLLDCRPGFLPRAHAGSLLLAPLGESTVLGHLRERIAAITGAPPVIAARFEVEPAYEKALRRECPDLERIETLPAFAERLHGYEPSDRLLLVDPSCFALDARDPGFARLSAEDDDDPRGVKHLVAVRRGGDGTKEYLDADASGRIRAIQRYYDAVTWPFGGGIACSLFAVASVRVSYELPLGSLTGLRRVLSNEGVPSRDISLEQGAVNLATERGLLAMNERLVLTLTRGHAAGAGGRMSRLRAGSRARVDPSASIVGPVVLQDDVEVRERATVIGPTVIGRGAVVEAGATVAQCVVGAGETVAAGLTLRHRACFGEPTHTREAPEPVVQAPADGWETQPLAIASDPPRLLYPAVKRAIDATVAAVSLTLLSPLCLLLAVLVKLESRGPIFFGHVREGLGGRPFRCWKFRTMYQGADQLQRKLAQLNQMDGPQFKVARDPRRTRLGSLLTASNLDELPQLWNVLVGQMSLVGPRPSPFRENQVCVPWREGRLSVRPGITGLWQICRHDRDKGDFHQWIYYDLLYVRNMSLVLDVKIAVLTVAAFVKGGYIPLRWLLSPRQYGERRTAPRPPEPELVGEARSKVS